MWVYGFTQGFKVQGVKLWWSLGECWESCGVCNCRPRGASNAYLIGPKPKPSTCLEDQIFHAQARAFKFSRHDAPGEAFLLLFP